MRKDTEDLLEHVLHAVMQTENDALMLAIHLRNTVPDARVISLMRALLAADGVIAETFNGSSPGRADAALARSFALTLAEAADDLEAEGVLAGPVRLRDLAF